MSSIETACVLQDYPTEYVDALTEHLLSLGLGDFADELSKKRKLKYDLNSIYSRSVTAIVAHTLIAETINPIRDSIEQEANIKIWVKASEGERQDLSKLNVDQDPSLLFTKIHSDVIDKLSELAGNEYLMLSELPEIKCYSRKSQGKRSDLTSENGRYISKEEYMETDAFNDHIDSEQRLIQIHIRRI